LARNYAPEAMTELARLATQATSEAARVAAIKELFDRGFGKAAQLIGEDPDNPLPAMVGINVAVLTDEQARALASIAVPDEA
jgi:hypothetical protein